jgi:predicted transcriptional regulator
MSTARLVRETRRAASLTQRELAEHSGVTQSVIAAIESASQDTRGRNSSASYLRAVIV